MIKVAILGYGTIGSGVYEYIRDNNEILKKELNKDIEVSKILDLKDLSNEEFANLVVSDFSLIEQDKDIDIVVECMGGVGAAYDFVKRAILSGKHVTTSNKALVAKYGTELIELAKKNRVNFMFEASVGGGIPIIRILTQSLSGENIKSLTGILNGTTNFILSKMQKDKAKFADILKRAQELGYAEANPEADILGYDACRKIAILSSIITRKEVDFDDIYTEGITEIDIKDLEYAKKFGKNIKLLANARFREDGFYSYVCPVLVDKSNPLYSVSDVYNAVYIDSNKLGKSMYYGLGAGKDATASAVVGDILDIAHNLDRDISPMWKEEKLQVGDISDTKHRYFVRFKSSFKDKVFNDEKYKTLFDLDTYLEDDNELILLTGEILERDFVKEFNSIEERIKFIRIL